MKIVIMGVLTFVLAGCLPEINLDEYSPVVDTTQVSAKKFDRDLAACRTIAKNAEAKYKADAATEMENNVAAGIVVGAILGAIIGQDANYAAQGAAYGGLAGVSVADAEHAELVKYGPRRIVDRCMAARNYTILNDIGRG